MNNLVKNSAVGGNESDKLKLPETAVIIPIMNTPIFPGMIAPIVLSEDKFSKELEENIQKIGFVALNLVKNADDKEAPQQPIYMGPDEIMDDRQNSSPSQDPSLAIEDKDVDAGDIFRVGVLCKVVKKLRLPDGSVNILVHGVKRYRASEFIQEHPLLIGKIEIFDDILEADQELDAYTRSVINQVKKLSEINPYFNEEMKLAMLNSPSPGALADLVAFSLSLDVSEAQDFLETLVVKKRFAKLLVYLRREKNVADLQKKISDEVSDKVNKYQREYFLREQLKVIRAELGMEEDEKAKDIKKMFEQVEKVGFPELALKAVKEEIERLEMIPDSSPEYNLSRTYIYWMLELPWSKSSTEEIDMLASRKILEHDHYGLEKAKERILEFLAVRKLKPKYDGTILCLAGPPGVGKTSLGKSIAKALGREFYRFSLGGMRDESEIKGHRRTYVGAMPGKIIQALKRVKVNNPVIMLDEIDKLGHSMQGDPASALLEVLDPEQNVSFIDNYIDIPFDLSKVLFIATANYINDIPAPLLDRMEVIELSGYSIEEKIAIGKKWVIPKQLEKHGLSKKDFNLNEVTLKKIIADFAREPGVRMMEQFVAKLCRKAALERVSSKRKKLFSVQPQDLEKLLGSPRFQSDMAEKSLPPGVVTGLAWTPYGGEILFIETLPLKGKGGFKLTGQVGGVMNESATLAYSYVKLLLQNELEKTLPKNVSKKTSTVTDAPPVEKKLDDGPLDFLGSHDIHLHLPAGATPKDGPSAGIAMALALYGLATNQRTISGLAMTGELSLTGKVLPIGGVKEKVLGAKHAGINKIILPEKNAKDLKEVPEKHRKGIQFFFVSNFSEVLDIALEKKTKTKIRQNRTR